MPCLWNGKVCRKTSTCQVSDGSIDPGDTHGSKVRIIVLLFGYLERKQSRGSQWPREHLQTCHKSETAGLQPSTNQPFDQRLERANPAPRLFRSYGCSDASDGLQRRAFIDIAAWVGRLHLFGHSPWTTFEKFWFCDCWCSFKLQSWRWSLRQQLRGHSDFFWLPSLVSRGHDTLAVWSMREEAGKSSGEPEPTEDKSVLGPAGNFVWYVGLPRNSQSWDSRTSSTSLRGHHRPLEWWRFTRNQHRWAPGCHELEAFYNHRNSFCAWDSNLKLVRLRHGEPEGFWRWRGLFHDTGFDFADNGLVGIHMVLRKPIMPVIFPPTDLAVQAAETAEPEVHELQQRACSWLPWKGSMEDWKELKWRGNIGHCLRYMQSRTWLLSCEAHYADSSPTEKLRRAEIIGMWATWVKMMNFHDMGLGMTRNSSRFQRLTKPSMLWCVSWSIIASRSRLVLLVAQLVSRCSWRRRQIAGGGPIPRWSASKTQADKTVTVPQSINGRRAKKKIASRRRPNSWANWEELCVRPSRPAVMKACQKKPNRNAHGGTLSADNQRLQTQTTIGPMSIKVLPPTSRSQNPMRMKAKRWKCERAWEGKCTNDRWFHLDKVPTKETRRSHNWPEES